MSETNHEIDSNFAGRLNILRAGVLGANDGIISIAGVVLGLLVLRAISGLSFYQDLQLFWPVPFQWLVENMYPFQLKKIPRKRPLRVSKSC